MIFRGWIIVAAVHAALFVVFGVAYSFAAFFTSFEREFGAGRGDIGLIFAICGFLYFTIGALTGHWADRFGARVISLAGIAFLAGGLALGSQARTLNELYVTYSLGVGLGVGFVYVPVVGALQPWFVRHRGLASGLAVAGIGLGAIVGPLLAGLLIPSVGWRSTLLIFAVGALLVGGFACALVENSPQRRGFGPDGERAIAGSPPRQVPRGIDLRAALRERSFWLMYAAIALSSIGLFVPFVHLLPYARDHGLSEATGIALVSLIGVGSMVGRFALAGIADRLPRRSLLAGIFLGMTAMMGWWLGATSFALLALFAAVFGAFYGAYVALGPAIAMDLFGARSVAGILGALYTGAGIGNLLGPWLAGLAYDWTRSYTMPIVVGMFFMGLAAGCAYLLARQPSRALA